MINLEKKPFVNLTKKPLTKAVPSTINLKK